MESQETQVIIPMTEYAELKLTQKHYKELKAKRRDEKLFGHPTDHYIKLVVEQNVKLGENDKRIQELQATVDEKNSTLISKNTNVLALNKHCASLAERNRVLAEQLQKAHQAKNDIIVEYLNGQLMWYKED